MFVCHPTPPTHAFQHSLCVCLSVCLCFPSLSLSLSPHCGREFATVIKFHVSFTSCYNISIWLALALFVSYLFSACAAVAVLSMPQKSKREMWKKNYEKISEACKTLASKICISPANWMLHFVYAKQRKGNRNKKKLKRFILRPCRATCQAPI